MDSQAALSGQLCEAAQQGLNIEEIEQVETTRDDTQPDPVKEYRGHAGRLSGNLE